MRRSTLLKGLLTTLLLTTFLLPLNLKAAESQDRVLEFTLDKLYLEKFDVKVILFFRGDQIHHGYALVPDRDNLPHRVDVTPSSPYEWVDKDGNAFPIPDGLKGRYSYKNKKLFPKYSGMYAKGEIDVKHVPYMKPLITKDKQLKGTVDILIQGLDEANSAGRNNADLVFRLQVEANQGKDGKFHGKALTWKYKAADQYYGKDNPKKEFKIEAQWVKDYWKPKPGTEYAPGSDWPNAQGPNFSNTAVPYDGELVNSLEDARLMWVAEDVVASGRSGGRTRGDFAMFPFSWNTIGYGGYGAPIIADGKVFVFIQMPDEKKIYASEEMKKDVYIKLGIDPRSLSSKIGAYTDTVFALDARTGKTLWRFDQPVGNLGRFSKSGAASTPAFYKGKVYTRGHGGIYALDANTGELIWRSGPGMHSAPDDGSVTVMGDTLLVVNRLGTRGGKATVFGLDLETGKEKWKVSPLGASSKGIPGRYVMNGKEYALFGNNAGKVSKKNPVEYEQSMSLIDPATGEVIWKSEDVGFSSAQVLVWEDMALTNYVRDIHKIKKNSTNNTRLGGWKLSPEGAKKVWENSKVHLQGPRTVTVVNNGIAYLNSRLTGFQAVDMKTGELLGRHPHIYHMSQGSHNWTWHVSTNDRIISSGLLMFTTADKGFDLLPGRLSLDITSGYRAPTIPAIADGRIVLRLADKIVCYDLRKHPDTPKYDVITLTAEDALVGVPAERDNDVKVRIRVLDGQPTTAAAKAGRVGGKFQWSIINWAGSWTGASPYRRTHITDLDLSSDLLKGQVILRKGWNYEPYDLDLKRDGDTFTGTYTRIAPALKNPFDVKGALQGEIRKPESGETIFVLNLVKGIPNRNGIVAGGPATENLTIAVITKDNKVLNAWAACGRLNTVIHEIDPKGLKVDGDSLSGELFFISHDDQYQDVHVDDSVAQKRASATGPALAIRYEIKAEGIDNKLSGSFEGRVGVEWKHSGTITGKIQAETAP